MSYQPLSQPVEQTRVDWTTAGAMDFSNTIPGSSQQKPGMGDSTRYGLNSSDSSFGAGVSPKVTRTKSWMSVDSIFGRRGARPVELSQPPWRHLVNEKRGLHSVPTTDTTRYFDRGRQTRRVFLDCFKMWLVTAVICAGLAGTLAGFSSFETGMTQTEKYAYNALVTGFSILLGLAFAAQFKQYCEMMRWRFLASTYRTIDDFEDVLSCDSWRTTFRLIFMSRKKGQWLPTKAQILAVCWLSLFIAFNVFVALIGLTYSIDVSDTYTFLDRGNISIVDLSYISTTQQNDSSDYSVQDQQAAAYTWGTVGIGFSTSVQDFSDTDGYDDSIYTDASYNPWWYRFVDRSSDTTAKDNLVTVRTINSSATCEDYKITMGGYAGYDRDPSDPDWNKLSWVDNQDRNFSTYVFNGATWAMTWMTNTTSETDNDGDPQYSCGLRCTQILVLQNAGNYTNGTLAYPPSLKRCNVTLDQVQYTDDEGFDNSTRLLLPDLQARILAGAIGSTGVATNGDDLQYNRIAGDNPFNPLTPLDLDTAASLVQAFSIGAISAMDNRGAPRFDMVGNYSPSPAQVVNVKWPYAGAILAGIPILQFLMLLGVVAFSSKAIILEPSYLTTARLLYPVLQKLGPNGPLMDVEEIAELLGHDYKIAYAVKPNESDPGHHDKDFVRDLTVVAESEGFGYIRGNQPTGRYD